MYARTLLATLFALITSGEALAGKLRIQFVSQSGITLDTSLVHLKSVSFWGCNHPLNVETVEDTVDLSSEWSIDLPQDDFCQVTIKYNTDLFTEGQDGGNAFKLGSQARQMDLALDGGQTVTLDLSDSFVLSGIYGGNPQIAVTRDP